MGSNQVRIVLNLRFVESLENVSLFAMETDGFVLNAAIDLYASATLMPQAGQVVSFKRAVDVGMQHKR